MNKHKDYEMIDESEIFKQKNLASAKNRKKFAKITRWTMYVLAALTIAACAFAYFIDK